MSNLPSSNNPGVYKIINLNDYEDRDFYEFNDNNPLVLVHAKPGLWLVSDMQGNVSSRHGVRGDAEIYRNRHFAKLSIAA